MIESSNYVSDAQLEAAYAALGLTIRPEDGPSPHAFMAQHHRGLRAVADLVVGQVSRPKPIAVVSPAVQDDAGRLVAAGYVVIFAEPGQVRVESDEAQATRRTIADLFVFGERPHACLSGDCPHEGWAQCVDAIRDEILGAG